MILFRFLCCIFIGVSQHIFDGIVYEKGTEEPLPGVYFQIKGTGDGGMTDSMAEFNFNHPSESVVAVFSYVGYKEKEVILNARPSDNVIYLEADIMGSDEVTVYAVKDIIENTIKNYTLNMKRVSSFTVEGRSKIHFKRKTVEKAKKEVYQVNKSYNVSKKALKETVLSKSKTLKPTRVFNDLGKKDFVNIFGERNGEFITPLNLRYLNDFSYRYPYKQNFNGEDVYAIFARRENEKGLLVVKLFITDDYHLRKVETFFKAKSDTFDPSFGHGFTSINDPKSGRNKKISLTDIIRKTITHTYYQKGKKTFLKQFQTFQVSDELSIRYSEHFSNYKVN